MPLKWVLVLSGYLPKVLNFVGYLQQELRQETMALEIDVKMILLQMAPSYP
ncbi:hypothetical protein [Coleofasciculus sp.]|uniref:hypothetical protein n=1 Tax=Coleofasciculus sp. TaxID=3100458 RepID=UPI003A4C147C